MIWDMPFLQEGKIQEAIAQYEQALRINPDYAQAHYDLGNAFLREGKIEEAIAQYEQALRIKPDYAEAHNNLGTVLWRRRVRSRKPSPSTSRPCGSIPITPRRTTTSGWLWPNGQAREAIEHYQQALRIKPDYAEAHNNLGIALLQEGKIEEAIAQYEQALRINPDFAEAHYNLGIALEQAGRYRKR